MSKDPPRQYFDANCFIAILQREDRGEQRWWNCAQLLRDAAQGNAIVVTSFLTLAEVTGDRGRPGYAGEGHRDVVRRYFDNPFIEIVELDRRVAELARDLQWSFPILIPNDSVHLASALIGRCDVLFTYDDNHLLPLDGQKFPSEEGSRDPWKPLRIQRPVWTGTQQLSLRIEEMGDDAALATLESDLAHLDEEKLADAILTPDKPQGSQE